MRANWSIIQFDIITVQLGNPHNVFSLFFSLVPKIPGGETSKGEDELQPGVSEKHAAGATTTGKKNKNFCLHLKIL